MPARTSHFCAALKSELRNRLDETREKITEAEEKVKHVIKERQFAFFFFFVFSFVSFLSRILTVAQDKVEAAKEMAKETAENLKLGAHMAADKVLLLWPVHTS